MFAALFPHGIAGWKEELDSPWLLAPVRVWWGAAARANQASPPAISHSSASEPLLAFAAECLVVSHCYFLSFLSVLWTFSPRFHWCDFLSNSVNSNLLSPFSCWREFLLPVIKVSSLHLACRRTGPGGFFTLKFSYSSPTKKYRGSTGCPERCVTVSLGRFLTRVTSVFPDLPRPRQQLFCLWICLV